jgi:hypothetical protein
MSESVVLVDFGASRIKAVHYSLSQNRVISRCECASPTLRYGLAGEAEGNPEDYWQALEATAGQLIANAPEIQDLWLCSEMHGFLLADYSTAKPVTGYISWQDQRALTSIGKPNNAMDRINELSPSLLSVTGMQLRSGLPVAGLAFLRQVNWPRGSLRFLTLVDWLLLRGGETNPRCHPTLAAGTGLYSLALKDWSRDLLQAIGINPKYMHMSPVIDSSTTLGIIQLCGKEIRVWGGLGDLQSAAYGLDFPLRSSILINLGTGSQVMAITPSQSVGIEVRPSALGALTHAITHIPAGRALNCFAKFIDGCAQQGGGAPLFWRLFGQLQPDAVLAADDCLDLNIFSSAWRFKGGGSVSKIIEGSFELPWFMRSLAKSWLTQYAQALEAIYPHHPSDTFLLGGGLSRRGDFIAPVLESLLGKRVIETPLVTDEETLDGLLKLAKAST